jgi:hypothetical protein
MGLKTAIVGILCATMMVVPPSSLPCVRTQVFQENEIAIVKESESAVEIADIEVDKLPEITGNFEISIPYIAPSEVVLVGRLSLEEGQRFRATIEADRGRGLFFGISNSPNVTGVSGVTWSPLFMGMNSMEITHRRGFVYVYVGSAAAVNSIGLVNTALFDVTLRIDLID